MILFPCLLQNSKRKSILVKLVFSTFLSELGWFYWWFDYIILLHDLWQAQGRHQSQHKFMKGQIRRLHGEFSTKNHLSYMHLTSEGLWSRIQEFANFKYQVNHSLVISVHKKKLRNLIVSTCFLFKFELPDAARTRVKKLAVIRNLCQKVVPYIFISNY